MPDETVAEKYDEPPGPRLSEFAKILNPLFWMPEFNIADRLLEFVCTLVRAAGLLTAAYAASSGIPSDTGWSTLDGGP